MLLIFLNIYNIIKLNFLENLGSSNIECVSSCQDTVKNTPIVEKILRVRCLPGDTLSNRKFIFCYSLYHGFFQNTVHL